MNRRGFLAALVGGAVLDKEKLLWQPGKKLISIPKPRPYPSVADMIYQSLEGQRTLFNPRVKIAKMYDEFALRAMNSMLDRWNSSEWPVWPAGQDQTEALLAHVPKIDLPCVLWPRPRS